MIDVPPFPMPGDEFDDGIVVASGWNDDNHIGVMLIHPKRVGEFYSIGEYRIAGDQWEQMWGETHSNIVPTTHRFYETFGFWGDE